jgi:hypothetical protein
MGLAPVAIAPSVLAADPEPPERLSADMLAAQALGRLAILDMKAVGSASRSDYEIAAEVLRTAASLAPNDQTILRLQLEAAAQADDLPTVQSIARTLMTLDPKDTVATLRYISGNISQMQTADERLKAYDALVGEVPDEDSPMPESTKPMLDPSVRSRLALDAALLARERGDIDGFANRLAKAVALDPTNKDAATLSLNFYEARMDEPVGTLELMLNLMYADPFDPEVYEAATRLLLQNGAYRGAGRMAMLSRRLAQLMGSFPAGEARARIDVAEWNSAGPDVLINRLSDQLDQAREGARLERRALEQGGKPVDGVQKPDDIHLPFGSNRMRMLAAAAIGDTERASTFLNELSDTARRQAEDLLNPTLRPSGMTESDVSRTVQAYIAELAWLRLWAGLQTEEAGKNIATLKQAGQTDADTLARLDAMLAYRTGKRTEAEAQFASRAKADPYSLLALAVMADETGDRTLAASAYRAVLTRLPADAAGSYARTRLQLLTGEYPEESQSAQELDSIVAGIPGWLESLIESPRRSISMDVQPVRTMMRVHERTPVRVTLTNNSPIPLGVGPDRPIDSRLLFAPAIEVGTQRMPGGDMVEVVSLDRRIRLLKGESIDAIVWPDFGSLSYALELAANKQSRVRWRVVQGFQMGPSGYYEPCPHCVVADTPTLLRRIPGRYDAVAEALSYALQTGGAAELAEALQSLVLKVTMPPDSDTQKIDQATFDALMEVIAQRFPTLPKASKILVLASLPSAAVFPPTVRIDQLAALESDESILTVMLALRTYRIEDPIFNSPRLQESPRLKRLAELVKDRLQRQVRSYATKEIVLPRTIAPLAPAPLAQLIPVVDDPLLADSLLPLPPDPHPVPVLP